MFNLLPLEEKNKVRREYRVRLFVFAMYFLIGTSVAALIFLFPTYINSARREREVNEKAKTLKASLDAANTQQLTELIRSTKDKIAVLRVVNREYIYEVLPQLTSVSTPDITIRALSYTRSLDDKQGKSYFEFKGSAGTRESLVAFARNLEKVKNVDHTELPDADLIASENISFSLKVFIK